MALADKPQRVHNALHMIREGLSCVCAKLESTTCKYNEIQEINVLKKFIHRALCVL